MNNTYEELHQIQEEWSLEEFNSIFIQHFLASRKVYYVSSDQATINFIVWAEIHT